MAAMSSTPKERSRPEAAPPPKVRGRALVIAIDGPAGSGKSTVATGVARALGLRRLDTGAMYRALTLKAIRKGVAPDNDQALAEIARRTRFSYRDSQIVLDGQLVGDSIRQPEVSEMVSTVAAHPAVREELVRRQREMIGNGGVVVEGRDIGTVVCPDADLKVFLTASPDERARRRHQELSDAGVDISYSSLKREQTRRDSLDTTREASPLVPASDAVTVDSTGKTAEEVVEEIVGLVNARGRARRPAKKRAPKAPPAKKAPPAAKRKGPGAGRRSR
jgi:CMP/dCMP kinase